MLNQEIKKDMRPGSELMYKNMTSANICINS